MQWLGLLKSLFDGIAGIFKWLSTRQIVDSAKAEQRADNLMEERDRVKKANDASNNVPSDAGSVLSDKNNRSRKDINN